MQTERWVHLGHGVHLVPQRGEAGADREVGTSGSRCTSGSRREAGADREVRTSGSWCASGSPA